MTSRIPAVPIASVMPDLSASLPGGDRSQPVASGQRSATTWPVNTTMPGGSSTVQNFAVGMAIGVAVMVIALVAFFVWKNWKKKRAEQNPASPSRVALHATPTRGPITRIQSILSRSPKSTRRTSPESQQSSPTPLQSRIRSMLSRGSTDSGRPDVVPPSSSRGASFSAVAPTTDRATHVSIVMDASLDPAPGGVEESLYKVTFTTERVYADPDSRRPIRDYEERLSKSDSSLFDRDSTLYMTKAVVAMGASGQYGGGLKPSGSSMPDLLVLPGGAAVAGRADGGYASLSSNVKARPTGTSSSRRQSSACKPPPRRHAPHNRASLPSTRFLHAALQQRACAAPESTHSRTCAATESTQSPEDSGYTRAQNSGRSAYQSLLKVQQSSPALLPPPTNAHVSVISVDHYEVNSPPTRLGVNSYMSFVESDSTRQSGQGSTSSRSRSGSDSVPMDGGVANLLQQLSITSVSEEAEAAEPGAPTAGSSSTSHGCKVPGPGEVPDPSTPKPAPGATPPVPPPRRDSVLRSRLLLQSRQRLLSGGESSTAAAKRAQTEIYRRSLSCPDLLAAEQDPTGQEAHGAHAGQDSKGQEARGPPQAALAADSGVDSPKSSAGARQDFVDHIREYRIHMPACQKPNDDYWVDPAGSPHSSASLSSSNRSSPLKSSLPRLRVANAQTSTLPGGSRPPLPPKPDRKTVAAKSRTLGSHLAAQPRRQQALSSTSSSDDTDVMATDLRPTVKHPVMNRLLSETSREYWILEDRDGAPSSFDEESSLGSPP